MTSQKLSQMPQLEMVFAVYDRMLKMRRGPFPHIKYEQLLYYFYGMAGDPIAI
jgi:hypothetical protein